MRGRFEQHFFCATRNHQIRSGQIFGGKQCFVPGQKIILPNVLEDELKLNHDEKFLIVLIQLTKSCVNLP